MTNETLAGLAGSGWLVTYSAPEPKFMKPMKGKMTRRRRPGLFLPGRGSVWRLQTASV